MLKRLTRMIEKRIRMGVRRAVVPKPLAEPDDECRGKPVREPVSASLDENKKRVEGSFGKSPDLAVRRIRTGSEGSIDALVVHLDALVDNDLISDSILKTAVEKTACLESPKEVYEGLRDRYIELTGVNEEDDFEKLLDRIADGNVCVLVNGVPKAIVCQVQAYEQRSVAEPVTETTVLGSKEGFIESLATNLSLIRRRIRNPRLRVEQLTLGETSRTPVALLYVEGIANSRITEEARRRLMRVQVDTIQESGQLEELIEDAPLSPFPTILRTERPDRVTGNLLEGRVAFLIDGSPFALIAPATFTMFLTTPEDYSDRFYASTAIRLLRYFSFLLSLSLPAMYVAVTTFHQELLPTPLILSIAAQRARIPFPAAVEATAMMIVFEMLREAGLRLPRIAGQAVSIIGALVIGEAALRAGLVSEAMVVVVALTGIASFITPVYGLGISVRLLVFPLLLLASALGQFGILIGLSALAIHLFSLRSFGVPFMEPLIPVVAQEQQDTIIRAPWRVMSKKPRFVGEKDEAGISRRQTPETSLTIETKARRLKEDR